MRKWGNRCRWMERNFAYILCLMSCVLCLLLAGCEEESSTDIIPDVDEFISEGWKEYMACNYQDAIDKFQKALEDTETSESYNGIGWSLARLGRIRDSIDSFNKATEKDPASADAHAGLAGAYFVDGDYERAIASAKQVLLIKPDYISHHDDIKTFDIRILLAECYYAIGNYAEAKNQVDMIGWAGKTLDPASPTYRADLVFVIEELSRSEPLAGIGMVTHFPR